MCPQSLAFPCDLLRCRSCVYIHTNTSCPHLEQYFVKSTKSCSVKEFTTRCPPCHDANRSFYFLSKPFYFAPFKTFLLIIISRYSKIRILVPASYPDCTVYCTLHINSSIHCEVKVQLFTTNTNVFSDKETVAILLRTQVFLCCPFC